MTEGPPTRYLDLAVLPLRETVIFPQMSIPLSVGRNASVNAVEHAEASEGKLVILTQKDGKLENPKPDDLFMTGTLVEIVKKTRRKDGSFTLLVKGLNRVKVTGIIQFEPFLSAHVEILEDVLERDDELKSLFASVRASAHEIIHAAPNIPSAAARILDSITDPGYLADICVSYLDLDIARKIEILELTQVKDRLKKVLGLLQQALEMLKLTDRIRSNVKEEMGRTQKEYYLREQMKAIRKELGDDDTSDVDDLDQQVQNAKMPPEVEKVAMKEVKRLRATHNNSAEAGVIRNYIEWLIDTPWHQRTDDNLDLKHAEDILHEDHHGLERVKRRILEHLAVAKLRNDLSGSILCLVGPPGVGKTSLGKSIARALNRKFLRISLGGVRDEAEIRGHRRTYIGAMPGKIISSIKKAGTVNPVMILDEIDKLGNDWRGDPSSALLEVLDPEQNNTFMDHYLDVPYDLSKVFFICTANVTDTIPPALKDRLEIIEIRGYTEAEKAEIAKKYLIPQVLKDTGLQTDKNAFNVKMTNPAVIETIRSYTRESGVRNLKREIENLFRAVAHRVAKENISEFKIDVKEVRELLGPQKHLPDMAGEKPRPGVVTGMAWTPVGGDILFIESTMMPGKGHLKITGQLGDVMKESAEAALSYIRAHAATLRIDDSLFEKNDIHLHVPAGAIPKDGPSAGVTMLVSLVSLLTNTPVSHLISMTGEITLRGQVLPVGGIKEKVLASHRAGIKSVFLPKDNQKDLEDIPAEVQKELTIEFIDSVATLIQKTLKLNISSDDLDHLPPMIFTPKITGSGDKPPVH